MKVRISAEDFVRSWQTHQTARAVAVQLRIPLARAMSRASDYRSRGINLKFMPR